MSLTARQVAFVTAYVEVGNATKAATLAGFKQPRVAGSKLLKVASVTEAIEKLKAKAVTVAVAQGKAVMSRSRALELLTAIAEGDIGETELSLSGDPVECAAKLKDRIAAVKQLARMEGWEAAIKQEHSGSLTIVPATEEAAMEALRREAQRNPVLQDKLRKLLGAG